MRLGSASTTYHAPVTLPLHAPLTTPQVRRGNCTLPLHYRDIAVTLPLYYRYTYHAPGASGQLHIPVTLPLHYRYITVTLPLHCRHTSRPNRLNARLSADGPGVTDL